MFQIWVGLKPGKNENIIPSDTKESADSTARELVLAAQESSQSKIASVFDVEAGVVVSGFATSDLRSAVSGFPQIQVL